MIRNSREKELPTKQEGGIGDDPTSSRLWPGLKNPRIVRVSRAFGGKDRHSKVSTIRGLRDRRVRLSVPTAIQLYDLQDRLGLNQPSKVVDWLLNAAQHEIDKLPPLQLPSENFIPFSQSFAIDHEAIPPQSPLHPLSFKNSTTGYINENRARPLALLSSMKTNNESMSDVVVDEDLTTLPKTTYWNSDASQRTKQREASRELRIEKGNIMKGNEVEDQYIGISQAPAHDPRQSSAFGMFSNVTPCNSYHHWESTNAYASNLGIHMSQMEAPPMLIPSSLSLMPGPQLVLCPSGAMPTMLPPYMTASTDFDARQSVSSASHNLPPNSIRTYLNSGRPTTKIFHSNLESTHHHSQDHHES